MNNQIHLIAEQICQTPFPIKADKGQNPYWYCTQEQAICWAEAYWNKDLIGEVKKAKAWLVSNPNNLKTPRGMGKFLNGWFSRSDFVATQSTSRF